MNHLWLHLCPLTIIDIDILNTRALQARFLEICYEYYVIAGHLLFSYFLPVGNSTIMAAIGTRGVETTQVPSHVGFWSFEVWEDNIL